MKLHLPKRLLTALLAALATFSLATGSAARGLTITGSGDLETITLNADTSYQGAYTTYTVDNAASTDGVMATMTGNGMTSESATVTFTIDVAKASTAGDKALVYNLKSTTNWGFQLYDSDADGISEITGRWAGGEWKPSTGTWGDYSVELPTTSTDGATSYTGTATYTAVITKASSTKLYTGTSVTDDNLVYAPSGLQSTDGISAIKFNTDYVTTVSFKEYSTLTFSNGAGWSMSVARTGVNNAVSSALSVGADGFGNVYDVIAGGNGGLTISATAEAPVSLSNTMYLAAPATEGGASVSIENAGAVELSGPIYLVEDATMASTSGGSTITISGAVTDKGVPTGSEGDTADGACTLSLSGTGYNFTGAVDVNGLHLAEDAEATFSNLTIGSTITGSGVLNLNGTLQIADPGALDNYTYTYADGTTSGLRTGMSATLTEGTLNMGEGSAVAIDGVSNVQVAGGTVTWQITSTVYDVNEALDYNADTMGTATLIQVNQAGTLTFAAGQSSSTAITNLGNVVLQQGAENVTLNTLLTAHSNVDNAAGNMTVATTGTATLNATLAVSGSLTVSGASSFTNAGYEINGGTLVLDGVTTATMSGGRKIKNNLVLDGTNLTFSDGEVADWGTANLNWKVLNESTLDMGTTRQTFAGGFTLVLDNASVTGSAAHIYGHVDFISDATISVLSDSEISAQLRLRSPSVVIDVENGASLTISNKIRNEENEQTADGGFTKKGSGTLILTAANTYGSSNQGGTTISAGVLELQGEGTLGAGTASVASGATLRVNVAENATKTLDNSITGSGVLQKSGAGTLTLDSANTSVTTLNVAAGKLVYNSSTDTTHTLSGNAGTTFEKTGSSTLTATTSAYNGHILVSAGTLKNNALSDKDQKVTVAGGATIDFNGYSANYNLTLQKDATLTSSVERGSSHSGTGKKQLHTITLEGDATVSGTGVIAMVGSGYVNNNLWLNGHTFTKTGSNTFYLVNTVVQTGGIIQVNEGTVEVKNISGYNYTPDITLLSLGVNGGTFSLSGVSQNIQDLTLTSGTVTIGSGLTLTTLGDVSMSSGTVSGNLCLSGTITLTGDGSNTVDMSGATLSATGLQNFNLQDTAVPATSGLGALTYELWSGAGSITGLTQTTISVGGTSYTLDASAGTFSTAGTIYYVVSGDTITAGGDNASTDTGSATAFVVAGTLNIAGDTSSDGGESTNLTVAQVLTTTTGTGSLVLGTNAALGNGSATLFKGSLTVGNAKTLTLGSDQTHNIDVSSFRQVILNDGGTIQYQATGNSTFNNLTVQSGTGTFYSVDTNSSTIQLAGETSVSQGATLDIIARWNSAFNIQQLVGAGSVAAYSADDASASAAERMYLTIGSLKDFSGSLSIVRDTMGGMDVEINTGSDAVDFNSLEFRMSNTDTTHSNSFVFNVQGDTTVTTLTAAPATVNIAAGKTLSLGAATHTIGTLHMADGSAVSGKFTAADKSLTIGTLTLDENATAIIGTYKSFSTHKGLFEFAALTGTNANLILQNGSQESNNTRFNLGGGSGSAFSGNIYVEANNEEDSSNQRSVVLNIKDATVAQNAVIHLVGKSDVTNSHVGLGIATSTTVAGISSGATIDEATYPAPGSATVAAGAFGTSGKDATATEAVTLTINAAGDYTTNAAVKGLLNLVKSGSGSQTFSGSMADFGGTIVVQQGELAFTGAGLETSAASVDSGARLSLSGSNTVAALTGAGTLQLNNDATLSLGGGTSTEERKTHTIGMVTAGTGASVSLGDYATLKLTTIPGALAASYGGGNTDATSSLNLAISGGAGSVLELALDDVSVLSGEDGWKRNSTVTLTQGENSQLAVRVSSGYLANCVFGVANADDYGTYATTNLGGSALSMADGTSLVLRKPNASENFGAGDITLEGAVGLNLYESVSAGDTSLTNSISGGTLSISGKGGITLAGNLSNMALVTEALEGATRKEVILGGNSISLSALTHKNGTLTVNGALTMSGTLHVEKGTLTVGGTLTASGETVELSNTDTSAKLRLEGTENSIGKLDFGKDGAARGTLELGSGSSTTAGALFMNNAVSINMENGAQLLIGSAGDGYTVAGKEGNSSIGIDKTGASTATDYKGPFDPNGSVKYILSNVDVSAAKSGDTNFNYQLTDSSITNNGSGTLTVSNVANTITNLAAQGGNVTVSESMSIRNISAATDKVVTIAEGKTISSGEGGNSIGTNGGAATMTAKSDSALVQLQQDATFTIEDMTLTNTSITAATVSTRVELNNVTNTGVQLAQGAFHMLNAATDIATGTENVGTGGSVVSFSTSLLSGLTLNASNGSSVTVDLGDLSGIMPAEYGTYSLSITLSGFAMDTYESVAAGAGVLFAADSWLGQLLVQHGATQYVSGSVETPATVSEGGSSSVSVSYSAATGDNVGTIITITGLSVPEPATATLSLLAMAALAARRRRK